VVRSHGSGGGNQETGDLGIKKLELVWGYYDYQNTENPKGASGEDQNRDPPGDSHDKKSKFPRRNTGIQEYRSLLTTTFTFAVQPYNTSPYKRQNITYIRVFGYKIMS
jgi:hypothetical protein